MALHPLIAFLEVGARRFERVAGDVNIQLGPGGIRGSSRRKRKKKDTPATRASANLMNRLGVFGFFWVDMAAVGKGGRWGLFKRRLSSRISSRIALFNVLFFAFCPSIQLIP